MMATMPANSPPTTVRPIRWEGDIDGHLVLLDQTRLPTEVVYVNCHDVQSVFEAIRSLRVRGAPAIGIAAAYGLCLGVPASQDSSPAAFISRVEADAAHLATSRPTAVNLFWALERMKRRAHEITQQGSLSSWKESLLGEARAIHEEDRATCHAIGRHGADLLLGGEGVLTHCNAGGLATSEYGTALAVIFAAAAAGKQLHVYVDETRPLLQGSRLTAWELMQQEIPATLICDSMAAQVMREGRVQAVVTGADRIAANGDVANKIGTYSVALAARAHGIPFYVAAPISTFDLRLASGDEIPIEERSPDEITNGFGRATAPEGIGVYNPAFDVTPAELVAAIICERGIIRPVNRETIAAMVG